MNDTVRTQIELPRDLFELLRQRSKAHGFTETQQIVEALTAYLLGEVDPVLKADDPILRTVAEGSGIGDLATAHDRYLYAKDWQERSQAEGSR
jgi:hypothetical protein